MNQSELKKDLNKLLILLLFIAFVISLVTGLIKFPEFQKFFSFIYNYTSSARISLFHDFSGLFLIGLIIIHLIIKRKRIGEYFINDYQIPKNILKIIYLLIGITVIAGIIIYLSPAKPVNLSAVEINDYQGEKLGSINDFRENSISGPQYIDKNSYQLEITGLVSTPIKYSYDDILKLTPYQKVVTINCVEGWSVKVLWEGILVKDMFKDLTISPEAKTVIFYAVDGYSTSFPIEYILNNDIIMADKMNGVVLPPERGFPFQLVAEQKWGYKWIKWITKIELSSDTDYKGFWESRGYNNDGSLDGSKFEQ
ncbi:MAG: molybdopterin-dependent oxidoreductase [Minisyncoccales bacterium]